VCLGLLLAAAIASCGKDTRLPTGPDEPQATQPLPTDDAFLAAQGCGPADITAMVKTLLPGPLGKLVAATLALLNLDRTGRRIDLARARMFEIVDTLVKARNAGLFANDPMKRGKLEALIKLLFCLVGLPQPPIDLGPDGAAAVVTPTSPPTLVQTQTHRAATLINTGDVPQTVLITITKLSINGPWLDTKLDQYGPGYEFTIVPAGPFDVDVLTGMCINTAGNATLDDRLRLAHNNPSPGLLGANNVRFGNIEIISETAGETAISLDPLGLTCSAPSLTFLDKAASYFLPQLLWAAGSPATTGGKVRNYSPFAAVDPPGSTVTVAPTTLPDGTVGTPYSATLEATGGTAPYAWAVSAGMLPTGLTLAAATGIISGTPTAPASATFTVRVTSGALTADRELRIAVSGVTPIPDGWLVYQGPRVNGAEDVCLSDVAGTATRCLGISLILQGELGAPRFSADRRRIVFDAKPADPDNIDLDQDYDVFVVNVDGASLSIIPNTLLNITNTIVGNENSPGLSPDGARVVYRAQGNYLAVRNADGSGEERQLTNGDDRQPDWSPDGSSIAFRRDGQVWLVDATTGANARPVLNTIDVWDGPRWSPDGSRLLYSTLNVQDGTSRIVSIAPDGTNRQVIDYPTNGTVGDPSWSPEGLLIGFRESVAGIDGYVRFTRAGSFVGSRFTFPYSLSNVSWR
jgi:hypothetical protein